MAKNLSVFLAYCPEFLSKIDQEFVTILGRWTRFCQQMAKNFLAFYADCPVSLVGKAEDFLKLFADDHKDLLSCLRKLSSICL